MIMSILPPPGLESIVPSVIPAPPPGPSCASSESTFDALPRWQLAQDNVQLIWQNAELKAQIALINENAALAQSNARLAEQLQHLNRKGRQSEHRPKQAKTAALSDIPSETTSTCASSMCGNSIEVDESDADGMVEDPGYTTAMMRNIPSAYTRANLLELLDQQGFHGSYDYVYLPVTFHTELNHCFAFINFTTAADFKRFQEHFTGFSDWMVPSDSVCEVCWSDVAQGIDAYIARYRNSPLMHESVADRFKPVLFENGNRVSFPKPTKKIRAPRCKKPSVPHQDIGSYSELN